MDYVTTNEQIATPLPTLVSSLVAKLMRHDLQASEFRYQYQTIVWRRD
jgi:hypothetical protein